MTEPGAIEKVPLKVVPMYIEPVIEGDETLEAEREPVEAEAGPVAAGSGPVERPKTIAVGALALVASVLTAVAAGTAIVIASGGEYPTSTALAYLAIGLSVVGIIVGIVAIALNRGRRLGAIAAVLGILANPYLLLVGLQVLGGTAIG